MQIRKVEEQELAMQEMKDPAIQKSMLVVEKVSGIMADGMERKKEEAEEKLRETTESEEIENLRQTVNKGVQCETLPQREAVSFGIRKIKEAAQIRRAVPGGKEAARAASQEIIRKGSQKVAKEFIKKAAQNGEKGAIKVASSSAGTAAGGVAAGAVAGEVISAKMENWSARSERLRLIKEYWITNSRKFKDSVSGVDSQKEFRKKISKNRRKRAVKPLVAAGKYILIVTIPFLLLFSIVSFPVVGLQLLYKTPFSILLPSLKGEKSVMDVIQEQEVAFENQIAMKQKEKGYDQVKTVYRDFEGDGATENNSLDVGLVYFVTYCVTASETNDTSQGDRERITEVFQQMNQMKTKEKTVKGKKTLVITITRKSYAEVIKAGTWNETQQKWIDFVANGNFNKYLPYSTEDANAYKGLTLEQKQNLMKHLDSNKIGSKVVLFAIDKLGMPYSQPHRDDGKHYDCSSLAYYSWKSQGVDISNHGDSTAAGEAHYLHDHKATVSFKDLKPGDLIFYSGFKNGRYKNITHVAVYCGGGYSCEASSSQGKVVYRPVWGESQIVMCGRPTKM